MQQQFFTRRFAVGVSLLALIGASAAQAQTSSVNQVDISKVVPIAAPVDPACVGQPCLMELSQLCATGANFGLTTGDIVLGSQSLKQVAGTTFVWSDTSACATLPPGKYYDSGSYKLTVVSTKGVDSNGKPYTASTSVALGVGLPGPRGARGLQGATGAQGPTGPQGNPGNNGTNGRDGAPGQNGKDGRSSHAWGKSCENKFIGTTPVQLASKIDTGQDTYLVRATVKAPWANGQKQIACSLTAVDNGVTTVIDTGETLLLGSQQVIAKGTVVLEGVFTPPGGSADTVTFFLACNALENNRVVTKCTLTANGGIN
jgi:Collagen triple helix repeat (20 copies)